MTAVDHPNSNMPVIAVINAWIAIVTKTHPTADQELAQHGDLLASLRSSLN
jgi:hypothetical protein